jgi:hypothetical protein
VFFARLWNLIRLLVHGRLRRRRNRHPYFKIDSIDGVEILAVRSFPNPDLGALSFPITDPTTIRSLFNEVDFVYNIDGRELGVDFDAFVFIRRPFGISKYVIVDDYRYLLPDNAWTEMHKISPTGQQLFRRNTTT